MSTTGTDDLARGDRVEHPTHGAGEIRQCDETDDGTPFAWVRYDNGLTTLD